MLRFCENSAKCHPGGKFPAVAINDQGYVLKFYQPSIVSTEIHYQVGNLTDGGSLHLSTRMVYDNGRFPKVALSNAPENRIVTVHEGQYLRCIYYRVGTIQDVPEGVPQCNWPCKTSQLVCWGRFPAVATHGDTVIITYERAYWNYATYYSIGTVNANGSDIVWGQKSQSLFRAGVAEMSVSMNDHYAVVAGRGWGGIVYLVAQIRPGPQLELVNEVCDDTLGYSPTVCLTANETVVLVWQTIALRQLRHVTGNIRADNHVVVIDTKESKLYDWGYNPTIAVSQNGRHVLEQHETNVINLGCSIHYHTGRMEPEDQQHVQELRNEQGQNRRPVPAVQEGIELEVQNIIN